MGSHNGAVLIGAIDQGTSSSRFLIYELSTKTIVASHQIDVEQLFPRPGWVEMDPNQILRTVIDCIEITCKQIIALGLSVSQIKAVGICNQRETTIVWDRETGEALHNAVVWLDCRTIPLADDLTAKTATKSMDHFKAITGLPIHPYFSALKLRWLIDNVADVRQAIDRKTLMFGTVDSWLIYKLTGEHISDVTNASRTLLMSLETLQWSAELCDFFRIPMFVLPTLHSSAQIYASIRLGTLKGVPLSGCLGDQQAAMFGEHCLAPGQAKCTYGTGTFLLVNVGQQLVVSKFGLLTTVAYKLGANAPTCYALEGSGAIGGNAIRFLRDNLGIIESVNEVEQLANSVSDTQGLVFVPCFTGLYTPQWDSSARGTICGLVQSTSRAHIARATLQAVGCQTAEMIEASDSDLAKTSHQIVALKVDGGLTGNQLFMQMLSDVLGMDVIKCIRTEASSWGVAVAAAIGAKLLSYEQYDKYHEGCSAVYAPQMSADDRRTVIDRWKAAISRAKGWAN